MESSFNHAPAIRLGWLQRAAGAILIVVGVGHLLLLLATKSATVSGWITGGPWAAVPLFTPGGVVSALDNALVFWSGLGSFAVPSAVLGGLVWWMAARGIIVPRWVGAIVTAWFAVGTVLLVPSPMFVGLLAGIALIVAGHAGRTRRAQPRNSYALD